MQSHHSVDHNYPVLTTFCENSAYITAAIFDLYRSQCQLFSVEGWGLGFVTECRRGMWKCVDTAGPHPTFGQWLTLNVDIAGSLLYLSMVWNLDEWLSSWYSSECLLRVCITFWKGRKEGTAKMKLIVTKKKPKQKGKGANRGRQGKTKGVKTLRDCGDASHGGG